MGFHVGSRHEDVHARSRGAGRPVSRTRRLIWLVTMHEGPIGHRYVIRVGRCLDDPHLFRWRIERDGTVLSLPGFAYGTAWSAAEAARVALHWHLVLGLEDKGSPKSASSAVIYDAV